MFLVTTAEQRYWKTDEKILFLGEWCKIYNQRHIWSKLDHEVLPYHWDDRDKLYQDYLYLQTVYERYLKALSERLNEIHGADHSVRYWRIVIGPWLFHFIPLVYDRYFCLRRAAESRLVTHTWVDDPPPDRWIPHRFSGADWFVNDDYNHYLYGYLIKTLGQIPFEIKDKGPTPSNGNSRPSNRTSLKQLTRTFLHHYSRLVPDRWNKVVFVTSYLSPGNLLRLQSSLGQLPYFPTRQTVPPDVPVQQPVRRRLILKLGRDQFESILDNLIAHQIPRTYLEGYAEMERRSLAALPRRPRVIFTADAVSDEGLRFWAARKAESGTRLVLSQHGGHYGSGLWSPFEEHEVTISDRYFTWGWQIPGELRAIPMNAGKVTTEARSWKPDAKGTILWIALSIPRYSHWLYSGPIGPQILAYLDEQQRFARAVSTAVHKLLLLRLYLTDFGWNEKSRWQEIDPTLKCYQGTKTFEEQISESRLVIATYNATTFLQTFSADFPTLIFWNPKRSEIRPAAQGYFDELRAAGILHDTPESAAAKANEIYQDPQSWWQQPMIQETKDRFCERFVRTSPDWLSEWKAELLDQANSSGVVSPLN
jgi:putative transferase (TIGR04331 family)